jgi:hypothetical protein
MSTSGSTPPLSRQPSREEMNANSEDVDTGQTANQSPSNPTQPKVADPKPKLSARPPAGTWVAAVVSPDAGSPRAPSAATQKSTEPRLVPRGPLPDLPKPPSSKVPSTSNLASTTLSAPTPSTSTPSTSTLSAPTPGAPVPSTSKPPTYIKSKVPAQHIPADLADALRATYQGMKEIPDPYNSAKMIQVPVFNLPPKQIARLMVGLESNFGQNAPSQDNLSKPLRDRFGIDGLQVGSNLVLDHINVIKSIWIPFMQRMFDRPESEQARVEVREQFDAFASGPHKNLLQTEEGKNAKQGTLHNQFFRELFQAVMQPLQSFILGADRKLESSQIPPEFKVFLKEIVKSYDAWGVKQDIAPKDLLGMIKSGLIGLLFIRGLLPVWNEKFEADLTDPKHREREWGKNKAKLSGQLAHYTSFLFDDFILDIIASTDGRSTALSHYFKPMEKAAELRRKEALVTGKKQEKTKRTLTRVATVSTSPAGNAEKRSNIGQFIQGLISPRKKALPTSPRSAKASERVQSAEGVLLKKTEARANNVVRKARRELNQYLKSIKLPNYDPGFIRYLNQAIASRANYEIFDTAPAAFCLQQCEAYVESLKRSGTVASPALGQIQTWIFNLAQEELTEAEQASQKLRQNQQTNPIGVRDTRPSAARPSIVPQLNLGVLANSPFADDSAEADEVADSAKKEPSDSTEVDTRHSRDSGVEHNSDESLENEKNQQ